ncbi:hypothetical protein F5X99DRAFT_402266 [Biscogniauxia marginata]|nr:hypothetical protein F5X99DRAFT_402266 [Biscogniauxia marginata]
MYSPWLRAFRSAALRPRPPCSTARFARSFHASFAARAADDSNNAPRDDDDKPSKENETGDGDNADENLFEDNGTATNGESQGRKRQGNGYLRSRTLRNRKPEELPPVQLPKSFLATAVSRYQTTADEAESAPENNVLVSPASFPLERKLKRNWWHQNLQTFEASAWTEQSVDDVIKNLGSKKNLRSISRRGDIMVAAAHCSVATYIREGYGLKSAASLLKLESIPNRDSWSLTMKYAEAMPEDMPLHLDHTRQIVDMVVDNLHFLPGMAVHHPALLEEVVMSIRADLLVPVPSNIKSSDIQRPITIINVQDFPGFSAPQDIVRHAANKLGADVVHLRAGDIAYIVGNYLGQDPIRAPGPISQLGYKAALNSGRLWTPQTAEEDGEDPDDSATPYAIVLRHERFKKDSRKQISMMDDFLNPSNRGKSDELWEDLKTNAALEELVQSANTDSGEQNPVIVHLGDFNAINMDSDCGAAIITKLRKVIDALWVEGRKIVLVGSVSSDGMPKAYLTALKELESKERVIRLRTLPKTRIGAEKAWLNWEKADNLQENDENIVRVLLSMVEQDPELSALSSIGTLGLADLDLEELPESWSHGVLPLTEVYRIATTIIGASSGDLADVFSKTTLEKAVATIVNIDKVRENMSTPKRQEGGGRTKDYKGGLLANMRKFDSPGDNHEERLMSGLVDAESIRTTFKDVHAPKETIESVKMLTTLSLIRPEAFSYGVLATDRIPGCLLYGPPGTGKTLLAKAVAKESGANMIEVSGAGINNMYVGESEKNVRALFSLAKKKEPMVIFIDEADALLGARGGRENVAKRETINQFLREWDGMDKMKAFIMVATNRPFDLDEAVLRRLPRKLLIDLPLEQDRAAILRIHLKDELLDEATVSVEKLAKQTPLYSGSDLKNVCVAAAMAAVKEQLELEAKNGHVTGESETETEKETPKRILRGRHFDTALREIGASVSEDMATLTAIRKFDEKYGDSAAARRRKRKGIGFGVVPDAVDSEGARIRGLVR